ncbi:MAG: hypothetical protein JSW39_22795 [Desulfobacterales bacterium]|nr:MAG: hypothetical protein JSW39_22795 [Desulfobacterales bacterium]
MNSWEHLTKDKEADILQSNFEHYYRMAIDHYTKAGSTSHILLIIVGALLAIIGYDKNICCTQIDIVCSILVIFVGFFGVVWSGRQMTRYRYWETIALEYQKPLEKIVPNFRRRCHYRNKAKMESKKTFVSPLGTFFACIPDRYLWILLHFFIILFGVVLLGISLKDCL